MIDGWRQLAAWMPRLLLALGSLLLVLIVIVIARNLLEMIRR